MRIKESYKEKHVQTHLKEWLNSKQTYICIKNFCIEEVNEDGGIIDGSYVNIDKIAYGQ